MLERRFYIGEGHVLLGENPTPRPARMLLGKPTRCVGRKRELTAIRATFEECVEESEPRVMLITGTPGAGKSRLGHEAIELLRRDHPDMLVASAYGDSMRTGSPLAMLGQLLGDAVGVEPDDSVTDTRDKVGRHLAELLAAQTATPVGQPTGPKEIALLVASLTELVRDPFATQEHWQLRDARGDGRLISDQMLLAFQDWLAALHGPVFLFLDDLQWSDEPTVRFINAALRGLEGRPIMVLALARPEIDRVFPDLWAARQLDRIALRPLSKSACANIAQQAVASQLSEPTLTRLIERSGGNPFYLEELLRSAVAGHIAELPDTVLAMVGARLRSLPASERRVLRAASVFGRRFWLGGITALLGDPPGVIEVILGRLIDREMVTAERRSRFADESEYSFVHYLTCQAAYATLPPEDRQSAHRNAGLWLEAAGETAAITLAEHFHQGQDSGRAVKWLHLAADQALAASAMTAAIEYAERAMACGASGPTLGAVRAIQAEAHNWSQEFALAAQRSRQAMALLVRGSGQWAHSAHQLAWACGVHGPARGARGCGPRAHGVRPRRARRALCGGAHRLRCPPGQHEPDGALLFAPRRGAESRSRRYRQSLRIGLHVRCRRHHGLPPRRPRHGCSLDGAGCRALESAQERSPGQPGPAQYRSHSVSAGSVRSSCHGPCGRESMALAASICRPMSVRRPTSWLSSWCIRAVPKRGLALLRAPTHVAHDTFTELQQGVLLTRIWLHLERFREALQESAKAEALANELEFPSDAATALALRARALIALCRGDEALEAATQSMNILAELGGTSSDEALWRLAHAEALAACGKSDEAKDAIAVARQRLLARADKIEDPQWRDRFLRNVTENRLTLDAADEWSADPPH